MMRGGFRAALFLGNGVCGWIADWRLGIEIGAKQTLRLFTYSLIKQSRSQNVFEVHIDVSLFTTDAAFGMVSGKLHLPVVPQVGDAVAFRITKPLEAFCGPLPFNGLLRVTHRIISPDGVSVALEDLTAATVADAQSIIAVLEENHGLFSDVWGN